MNHDTENFGVDLHTALLDIARSSDPLQTLPGPNNWDNITPEDFGPEWDYELYDHGTIWIFWPHSNAALQWCYKHLPEDAPRWGAKGYAVEHRFIEDIVKGAKRDNLMSEHEYNEAQEENHNLQLQREPTHGGCML